MGCTAEEIAEKRRVAMERLKQTKETAKTSKSNTNSNTVTSPGTAAKASSAFYGNQQNDKANALNQYENKMKHETKHSSANRILSQPYSKRHETASTNTPLKSTTSTSNNNNNNNNQKPYSIFTKAVTCTCSMISQTRFQVATSGYSEKLIDIFKSIPTRAFNQTTRIWTFDLSLHEEVQKKVSALKPDVVIGPLPKYVLKLLAEEQKEPDFLCLQAIEKKISSLLLDFQKYGVAFGISHGGRCMIADDMGLGKTFQAIAIADFYKDDWPLLIVTTATARSAWEQHIKDLLPSVPSESIKCLTTTSDYVSDCKVLITSYSLMEKNGERFKEKNFGFVILDESHTIKNFKTKSTQIASLLCENAKRIILLSGTPALSRPAELFSQLSLIDKKFFGGFREYSTRYCAGRDTTFGWNSSGSSNLAELNIILQRKFMIRRTKEIVQFELGAKSRETILLDSKKVWNTNDESMRETIENCKEFSADVQKLKGNDQKEVLLRLYAESAKLKANAVCSYVTDLVKQKEKFIIFGYHMEMLNALSNCMKRLKADYIRIDGSTRSDLRSTYIDRFQKQSSCQVAVLSLKACNAAITLTAASLVIFAELDWNPSTLAQCESRAHRIGQKSPVICRYLLATGTIDDYMWNMVKGKQEVLSKAGIFSEDLTDATHSSISVSASEQSSTEKITTYFGPESMDAKEACQNRNNNNQAKDENNQENQPSTSNTESMDYKSMLDDGDDDFAMLDLEF